MNRLSIISFLASLVMAASLPAQSYPAKAPSSTVAPPASTPACPWLTEGSAAAALGGGVRVALNIVSDTQGTCTFTKKEAPTVQLKVVVGLADVPACPAGSAAVAGIGTQASRCRLTPSHDVQAEMISGKVRAVNIAVTLFGVALPSSKAPDYRPAVGIDQIAEQVAGNLF